MPLTRRQKLAYKLSNRYHVRRSIFTLLIPVIIGAAIFGYAVYSGFAPLPLVGGSTASGAGGTGANATSARQAAYAALVAQLNAINATSPANKTKAAPVPTAHASNPHNFDLVLTASLIIGGAPYSADSTLGSRRGRKYEQDFTDFLFELSELVRGGIDPIKATVTLSQGSLGSITKQVQVAAKQMEIGFTFEQAMRNLATTLKSPLINRYIDLVIQASYSGGAVANLIQRASADMNTFLNIEKEKRAGLSQYTIVLYAGQVILIALSAILVVQFLPDLGSITLLGSTSFTGSLLGKADIGSVPLERDLYLLVVINGFMGGLVIGKISEGKLKHGIKHSLVLVFIAFLAWSLFVVPATSGGIVNYDIKVTSYGLSGPAGVPMTEPLTINVTTHQGAPAVNVLVHFSITAPPGSNGASLNPTTADTDTNGEASVQIVLGSLPGVYGVTATVGTNSTSVAITATNTLGGAGP